MTDFSKPLREIPISDVLDAMLIQRGRHLVQEFRQYASAVNPRFYAEAKLPEDKLAPEERAIVLSHIPAVILGSQCYPSISYQVPRGEVYVTLDKIESDAPKRPPLELSVDEAARTLIHNYNKRARELDAQTRPQA